MTIATTDAPALTAARWARKVLDHCHGMETATYHSPAPPLPDRLRGEAGVVWTALAQLGVRRETAASDLVRLRSEYRRASALPRFLAWMVADAYLPDVVWLGGDQGVLAERFTHPALGSATYFALRSDQLSAGHPLSEAIDATKLLDGWLLLGEVGRDDYPRESYELDVAYSLTTRVAEEIRKRLAEPVDVLRVLALEARVAALEAGPRR